MHELKFKQLKPNEKKLIAAAIKAQKMAYAPYSKFKVGSVVEDSDGGVHSGCNVENASYSVVTCAERVAIGKMVSVGERKIRTVVVVTSSKDPVFPCGVCLQVIGEFGVESRILAVGAKGNRVVQAKFLELMPEHFSSADMKE